jgi:hypothetical protein
MSVTIFKDVEEALAREVRRITTHNARTLDKTILKETYDPISGEVIVMPIQAEFYDSSADAGGVEYPHFFIKLLRTREDRFSGRVVPEYGKWITQPLIFSPKAFEIVLNGSGLVSSPGNDITTSAFQIRKIQPGYLIRLLSGNNKGTYKVSSITVNNSGSHTISLSNILVNNLPIFNFDSTLREVVFKDPVDITTAIIGDVFTDSLSNNYNIVTIDAINGKFTIDGSTTPSSSIGSRITRSGNVLQNTDLSQVSFIVMDPLKPVSAVAGCSTQAASLSVGISPAVPLDTYYLVRIDSKTRQNHIDILNRVWEEFNPPRTGLPVIVRTALSADELLTADITTGGSNIVQIADNSNMNVGDKVYLFDELTPTKRVDGEGFQRPFESIITDKISTNQVVLQHIVPDTYKISNSTRIVTNAEFQLLMFHFSDHVTKDVEGSQYWVHEFTFWVQIWIDRLEQSSISSAITSVTDIAKDIEDIDTQIILSDE